MINKPGELKNYVIIYALAVVLFHLAYGLSVLNPCNINWLMSARHDWGQHYLGWAFWREEPWTFPLGKMQNYIYPLGSNMGFTDSIPLMALLFKPFSSLLPEDFQYLGIWLLGCYIMAAHYTYKICTLYKIDIVYTIIAVLLVTGNPVLVYRGMHPSLCSHGFILAAVYYYLTPATPENVAILNRKQIILTAISALVTPYLTAMIIGFNIILPLKHWLYDKYISRKKAIVYFASAIVTVLLIWVVIGLITFGSGESLAVSGGYGPYAFNLNNLFNSSGFSPLMPQLPWVTEHQYEGFMYLGLGVLVFVFISLMVFISKGKPATFIKTHKWLLPLFLLALAFSLFAITNKITYNDTIIVEIPLPRKILRFFSIFRASARFFWLTYYLIILFFLLVFFRAKLPKWAGYTVLALVLAVQAYDISPIYKSRQLVSGAYDSPLDETRWNALLPAFSTMVTYPPFNNHLLNFMDYQDLSFLAVKNKMAITTGYSARDNTAAYSVVTDSITAALFNGEVNPKDLYVTTKQNVSVFGALLHNKQLAVQYVDGYFLLYDKNAKVPVVRADERSRFVADSLVNAFTKAPFIKQLPQVTTDNGKIEYNIEEISMGKSSVRVKGWAYLKETQNNKGDKIYVTITDNGITSIASTEQIKRPDLTTFFKKEYLEDSGYSSAFFGENNWTAETHLGIAIESKGIWTFADLGPLLALNRNKKPAVCSKLPVAGKVMGNVDDIKREEKFLVINGWAAFEDAGSANCVVKMLFVGEKTSYISNTAVAKRDDVTKAFKGKFNYDNSGYNLKVDTSDMKKGTYKVALVVSGNGREEMKVTDKTIEVE